MLNLFKKKNQLSEVVSDLNPLQKDSKFQWLKNKLFPHQAEVKRRNRYLLITVLFLALNYGIYLGAFKEYESFAYNSKTVQYSPASTDLFKVREIFTSAFGQAGDSPFTIYSYLSIISLIALILLVEYVALNSAYQYFSKKIKHIVLSIAVFIAFQLLYLAPILLIVVAETHVVDKLITVARAEVLAAQSAVANKIDPNIVYSQGEAVTKIASTSGTIYLLSGDFDHDVVLTYLNIESTDSFYRAVLLPYAVTTDTSFEVPHHIVLFPNHKIAISNKIEQLELAKILSSLSLHAIAQSELKEEIRGAKSPDISFLEESEYNTLENKKIEKRTAQFLAYLNDLNINIKTNNQYIKDAELAIANLKSDKSSYEARVRPLLADCIRDYGEAECSEPQSIVNKSVSEYDAEISHAESYLAEAKNLAPLLSRQYSFAKQSYERFLDYPITPEVQAGLFEPPKSIFIKYLADDDSAHSPANYYYTLLHELVHYYSYSPRDDSPMFLEEGITDLLALRVGGESTAQSGKVDGYPDEIKIAEKLFKVLGQKQATKLFFAKSKSAWQRELDKVCGVGCFKKLESVATELSYTPLDDDQARKEILRNTISILE